jgi:hypothetical protein
MFLEVFDGYFKDGRKPVSHFLIHQQGSGRVRLFRGLALRDASRVAEADDRRAEIRLSC